MRCKFLVLAAAPPSPHFVSRRVGEVSRKATNFSPFLAAVQCGNDDEKAASMVSPPNSHSPPRDGRRRPLLRHGCCLRGCGDAFTHRCCGAGARCLPDFLPASVAMLALNIFICAERSIDIPSPWRKCPPTRDPVAQTLCRRAEDKKSFFARRQLAAGEGGGILSFSFPSVSRVEQMTIGGLWQYEKQRWLL